MLKSPPISEPAAENHLAESASIVAETLELAIRRDDDSCARRLANERSRSRPSWCGRHSTAFTLIELLVCIGIIATLAALSFTGLQRAKASADEAGCIANLRKLGQLSLQFSSDHDGYLPPAMWAGTADNPVPGQAALNEYQVGISKRILCPSEKTVKNMTYGINLLLELGPPGGWGGPYAPYYQNHSRYRVNQITAPSKLILFADSLLQNNEIGWYRVNGPIPSHGRDFSVNPRHAGGKRFNAVFVDGHTESVAPQESLDLRLWSNGLPPEAPN